MSARVARNGLRAAQHFSVARPAMNGLRTYATPAQEVKPPVSLFGVDGTYATALVCLRLSARLDSLDGSSILRLRVSPTPPTKPDSPLLFNTGNEFRRNQSIFAIYKISDFNRV